jgi:hypothetical protein
MEQKMCPICGKEHDTNTILLDRRMKKQFETKTTTGYGLCEDCQKKKDEGYLALIVCDPAKTQPVDGHVKMENAYRTGEIVHIKREVFGKIFNTNIGNNDFVFIEPEVVSKLKEMMK